MLSQQSSREFLGLKKQEALQLQLQNEAITADVASCNFCRTRYQTVQTKDIWNLSGV